MNKMTLKTTVASAALAVVAAGGINIIFAQVILEILEIGAHGVHLADLHDRDLVRALKKRNGAADGPCAFSATVPGNHHMFANNALII